MLSLSKIGLKLALGVAALAIVGGGSYAIYANSIETPPESTQNVNIFSASDGTSSEITSSTESTTAPTPEPIDCVKLKSDIDQKYALQLESLQSQITEKENTCASNDSQCKDFKTKDLVGQKKTLEEQKSAELKTLPATCQS